MLIMGVILLCALLALFPLLIRIAIIVGLLMACIVYVWLAGATVLAFALWLLRRARAA